MPAISPARLKRDAANLFSRLGDPQAFDRALEDLFEFYADRTYRPSRSGKPAPLLPAYHVPKPVLRELNLGLTSYAAEAPEAALKLAGRMWSHGMYEYMLLAVQIVAALPNEYSEAGVRLLRSWIHATSDESLLEAIFQVCAVKAPAQTLEYAGVLLESEVPGEAASALIGLTALAKDSDEALLPGVYKLLGRILENPDLEKSVRTHSLVRALAVRSPAETAYFLRQYYLVSMRPQVGRMLRQSLPLFPEPLRGDLRKVLREHAASGGNR